METNSKEKVVHSHFISGLDIGTCPDCNIKSVDTGKTWNGHTLYRCPRCKLYSSGNSERTFALGYN